MINIDPFRPARSLALYDWPERVDFAEHAEILLALEATIHVLPGRVQFTNQSPKKERNAILASPEKLAVKIRDVGSFDSFSMRRLIDNDERNPELDITLSAADWSRFHLQVDVDLLSITEVIGCIRTFCRYFTPDYGYSTVMPSFEAIWFHAGGGTTSMDRDMRRRADALSDLKRPFGTPNPINGRIHDIYEINVLSPKHLEREVFDQPLAEWIGAGKRGELINIKKNVHVWTVPDNIRHSIRDQFFKAGLLLVPV
jgi:hypothetical protein